MKIKEMIELASAMNSKGTKRITLKYNDRTDMLFIQEDENIKPIRDDRFDDLMDRPIPEPEVNKATIELLKEELNLLNYQLTELKEKSERLIYIKVKKKQPAPLTQFENKVAYYYFLYNNDLGQGEGKLWPGMRRMPKGWVEMKWHSIVAHYTGLGYWIQK